MATKSAKEADARESSEDAADSPVLDSLTAAVRKMIARGKERGYVTYDELNAALPPDQVSSEQIEDTMTMISEIGINVTEIEDADDGAPEERTATGSAGAATVEEDDLGRTDDPVRMYLREMGSVELLSREGEIAIAKRIKAGGASEALRVAGTSAPARRHRPTESAPSEGQAPHRAQTCLTSGAMSWGAGVYPQMRHVGFGG